MVSTSDGFIPANEERYTKRKLEIKFPYNAISNALEFAGITEDKKEVFVLLLKLLEPSCH